MYARVNLRDGGQAVPVAHIEKSDRRGRSGAGNRGLTTRRPEDRRDRRDLVLGRLRLRDRLTNPRGRCEGADGTLVTEAPVAVAERPMVPDPATVQMTRVQLDPVRLDAGLAFVRDELQRLSACSGLCSAELLIDRVIATGCW
jgi:hypothetical protein